LTLPGASLTSVLSTKPRPLLFIIYIIDILNKIEIEIADDTTIMDSDKNVILNAQCLMMENQKI
jgi:hypothetical protein